MGTFMDFDCMRLPVFRAASAPVSAASISCTSPRATCISNASHSANAVLGGDSFDDLLSFAADYPPDLSGELQRTEHSLHTLATYTDDASSLDALAWTAQSSVA